MAYVTTDRREVQGLELVKGPDGNGTEHYIDNQCPKCGGYGRIKAYSYIEGGICFLCGGTGHYESKVTYRTPEYQEKLNLRRLERERKNAGTLNAEYLAAEGFSTDGVAFVALGDTYEIKDELKAAGARYTPALGWYFDAPPVEYPCFRLEMANYFDINTQGRITGYDGGPVSELVKDKQREYKLAGRPESVHVGTIGQRLDFDLTCTGAAAVEGYRGGLDFINFLNDAAGNDFIWKTGHRLPTGALKLRGTIKDHKDYKGRPQTILTRCKVAEN